MSFVFCTRSVFMWTTKLLQ